MKLSAATAMTLLAANVSAAPAMEPRQLGPQTSTLVLFEGADNVSNYTQSFRDDGTIYATCTYFYVFI